jgi:hypothetical protein
VRNRLNGVGNHPARVGNDFTQAILEVKRVGFHLSISHLCKNGAFSGKKAEMHQGRQAIEAQITIAKPERQV